MKLQNWNMYPVMLSAPTVAGTPFTVTHGCTVDNVPVVPRGLIVTRRLNLASLYFDPATWTTTQATLTCDTSSAAFNVLFFT
jgi:hypothetical protein